MGLQSPLFPCLQIRYQILVSLCPVGLTNPLTSTDLLLSYLLTSPQNTIWLVSILFFFMWLIPSNSPQPPKPSSCQHSYTQICQARHSIQGPPKHRATLWDMISCQMCHSSGLISKGPQIALGECSPCVLR